LTFAGRSLAIVLKLLLLAGLFVFCLFVFRFIIPENFGIFRAIRTGLTAITPVIVFNTIVSSFYAKYILWAIAVVWLLDAVFISVFFATA